MTYVHYAYSSLKCEKCFRKRKTTRNFDSMDSRLRLTIDNVSAYIKDTAVVVAAVVVAVDDVDGAEVVTL